MRAVSRAGAIAVVAATVWASAGCTAVQDRLDAETARTLQTQVLDVTKAVASGDLAGALDELTELESVLDESAAEGRVPFSRYQEIDAALEAVRAGVQKELAAQQAPPADEGTNEDGSGSGTGGAGGGQGDKGDGGKNGENPGRGNGNDGGNGNGNGNGNGGPGGPGEQDPPSESPPPVESPSPEPGPEPTPTPT